jgi:type II secretory pathway pseudopilin PulG
VGRRVCVVAVVTALAAPVAAQQQAASPSDLDLRNRIQIFEAVLQRAVLQGGQQLASQPYGSLVTTGDALAHGFPTPVGIVFDVEVPDLAQTFQWLMMQPRPQAAGPPQNNRVVVGQGLPAPDPMTGSGAPLVPAPVAYSRFVRAALIDAMLDNSGQLPLKDDEYLTVAASPPLGPVPTLQLSDGTLILSIKGSDLAAFHQGKISKDEARQRIIEKHF